MESLTKNRQSIDNIKRMLQAAFGEKIYHDISVNELTEGYFNVAYEVKLDQQELIIKIAPPKASKIMSYEENIMRAEVDAVRMMKEETKVPVPEVYYYDDTHEICDADYFIMEKLSGASFYKLRSSGMLQEEQDRILHEVGRCNKAMNEVTGNGFGYLGQAIRPDTSWRETFLSMIEGVLTDGERIEIGLGVGYDEVRDIIHRADFALDTVTRPVFVHWDLWDGNVFIEDGRITGIIDFERALWGDPLMEYYFRAHSYNMNFIQGYGRDLRKEEPIRALLYDIYLYLIMVVETKYRSYPNDWQYNFASKELKKAMDTLSQMI
ncbi:MAG TPA: aminoglycoside phosphotransferase family protein [Mobilitalea sp.]|nr:aminoglycoside phosphotransferase family protein [Mobilitalea sp.]